MLSSYSSVAECWPLDDSRDLFSDAALLDLRSLNETVAGETGWISVDAQGDFVRGDGSPIRFWAVGTDVKEREPRELQGWDRQYLDHQSRWLAKRGVNMVRTHAFINPSKVENGIRSVRQGEVEWIWKVVGAMKKEGIYTTVSPYWANQMKSDDALWNTDWQGQHHGLLFFETELKDAYKEWLRYLFTTPTEYLGGKTLADDPALALFQIQNEDSLLFWTVNNLKPGPARRLGILFGDWLKRRYGSLDAALLHWNQQALTADDLDAGVISFENIWNLTAEAARYDDKRLADQLEFWVETMRKFNQEIADFVHQELHCPVLINAGNWKTADSILLNDSERYSYTVNDVLAVNRYFNGIHEGPNKGWAIVADDFFQNKSVLDAEAALDFSLNLKQVKGYPMLVTESTWVYPMATGFEAPLLVSAYSSLSGVDAYYWFSSGVDDFEIPRSANGYLPESQAMWLCMNPDMAGQWPAAALMFRKGLLRRGDPVVEEHRSLASLWSRRTPLIAESSSFDPNRDAGLVADGDRYLDGVTPWAFFAGPVEVVYDSTEAQSMISDELKTLIEGLPDEVDADLVISEDTSTNSGPRVRSITGELQLDTGNRLFSINAPAAQGIISYAPADVYLDDVIITSQSEAIAVIAVAMDGESLSLSGKVLVQVGTPSRPFGWQDEPATFIDSKSGKTYEGRKVVSVGKAPWMIEKPVLAVIFKNRVFDQARVLDMNGMPVRETALETSDGNCRLNFPQDAMYVMLMRNSVGGMPSE